MKLAFLVAAAMLLSAASANARTVQFPPSSPSAASWRAPFDVGAAFASGACSAADASNLQASDFFFNPSRLLARREPVGAEPAPRVGPQPVRGSALLAAYIENDAARAVPIPSASPAGRAAATAAPSRRAGARAGVGALETRPAAPLMLLISLVLIGFLARRERDDNKFS